VQATGWKAYDPDKLADKYGYGKLKNVDPVCQRGSGDKALGNCLWM
jgi:hypothetical protein